jgi:hypothetical protein
MTIQKMSSPAIEGPVPVSAPSPPIVKEIMRIEDAILQHPELIDIALTELHALLQKFDPAAKEKPAKYPLVPTGFNSGEVLEQICELSKQPKLKVTEVRFAADRLAKLRKLALPKQTMHHKDSLLLWYKIHWDVLKDDIRTWKDVSGGSSDDD